MFCNWRKILWVDANACSGFLHFTNCAHSSNDLWKNVPFNVRFKHFYSRQFSITYVVGPI